MDGLQMKYFLLKPRAKHGDDAHATASQQAMLQYANQIKATDRLLAEQLSLWARKEEVRQDGLRELGSGETRQPS